MPTTGSGRALTRLLEIGDRVEIVGSAGEAGLALEIVEATAPDVVVVDPRLPEIELDSSSSAGSGRWPRPFGSWSWAARTRRSSTT